MSRGINKVTLIGRLGQDPEVRYAANGNAVANISMATSYKPRNGEEETDWHRVILFGKTAEVAQQYLKKGATIYIEGRLKTRKWADNQGVEKWTTEVLAFDMQMLDSRGSGSGGASRQNTTQSGGASRQNMDQPQGASGAAGDGFDDIPF